MQASCLIIRSLSVQTPESTAESSMRGAGSFQKPEGFELLGAEEILEFQANFRAFREFRSDVQIGFFWLGIWKGIHILYMCNATLHMFNFLLKSLLQKEFQNIFFSTIFYAPNEREDVVFKALTMLAFCPLMSFCREFGGSKLLGKQKTYFLDDMILEET